MADELVTIIDKPVKLDLDIGDTTVVRVAERDHSKLENLDYEHSGHTGFASQTYADTLSSRITQNEQGIENNSNRITELGKTVNTVRESIPTKTSEIENDSDYTTKEYVDTQLGATTVKINSLEENKLDKTGGVITGNLTVAGTVTTEKQKTLEVEDNIVYTNANKVALQALLSGLAIYKDGTNIYGILYDPATDSVKLGAGYRDASGIFHFNANDGSPVAVREDSTKLTDKHIMIWDSATNKLIDSGKTVDEFIDLISEQTIGGLKKFAEQIQANKGIHSDGDIIANNANFKATDTTKDAVAQYGADKITLDDNNNIVEITLKSLYNATHYIRYKEDEPTPPTPIKEAGLYEYGILSKSWAQLIADGDVTVADGALKVANNGLAGELVCDNVEGLTNLAQAFQLCTTLTNIDVLKLDTSNVTNMVSMFAACASLSSLDLSSFDTSNVTDMGDMFSECSGLTSLDVSSFDTSNVTRMLNMFYNCSGLTSLNLSNFNTSNVEFMSGMFYGCSSLTSLDISNFTFDKVTHYDFMFYNVPNNCEILVKSQKEKDWITSKFSNLTNVKIKGVS